MSYTEEEEEERERGVRGSHTGVKEVGYRDPDLGNVAN